jgi:hypothetical protein
MNIRLIITVATRGYVSTAKTCHTLSGGEMTRSYLIKGMSRSYVGLPRFVGGYDQTSWCSRGGK